MSLLSKATRGARNTPRAICIYGTHGVGKSTLAACADSPIVLDIEGGTGTIDFAGRLDGANGLCSLDDVFTAIGDLINDEHDYKTLVIDSLDWLEQWVWDSVCRANNVESIEKIGYGKGYVYAIAKWRELLEGLDMLRTHRGMTILLLAHSKVERFEAPDVDTYDRYSPKLDKRANAVILEWCDEVLFATYQVHTRTSEDRGRQRRIGIGTGERILRCTERPGWIAKNRLSLPDELPLDWDELASFFPTDKATAAAS